MFKRSFKLNTSRGALPDDDWSEEAIVFLHLRLLDDVACLSDPETPLDKKFDTLRWVFTDPDRDRLPFSFVNCLNVAACSPLSPLPYCGAVDAGEIRDMIRTRLRGWMEAALARYPEWVREAVLRYPEWVEKQLQGNPQWFNEELKKHTWGGDLFV